MKAPDSPLCVRCGHPRSDHWLVNYADGPHVGGAVLLCPTAIYTNPKEKP